MLRLTEIFGVKSSVLLVVDPTFALRALPIFTEGPSVLEDTQQFLTVPSLTPDRGEIGPQL